MKNDYYKEPTKLEIHEVKQAKIGFNILICIDSKKEVWYFTDGIF